MTDLVSTEWLEAHLNDPEVLVLDATFKLPGALPTARDEYAASHIPGAHFFDVDEIADKTSPLPHMLPAPAQFEAQMRAMGLSGHRLAVIYDRAGLFSAGRAWWMLRAFGHARVAILNGGLKKWLAEKRAVTTGLPATTGGDFKAAFDPSFVVSRDDVLANLQTRRHAVLDARSAARFTATEKEARPGLRSGHIPDSHNLPFDRMTVPETGEIRSPEALKAAFADAKVDLSRPIITSCGSGVTACALAFGLHLLGKRDVAVYDGAWAEWGQPGDTPVLPQPVIS